MDMPSLIRAIMDKRGLNVAQVAQRLGVSRKFVYEMLGDQGRPGLLVRVKALDLAGYDFSEMLLKEALPAPMKSIFAGMRVCWGQTAQPVDGQMGEAQTDAYWRRELEALVGRRGWNVTAAANRLDCSRSLLNEILNHGKEVPSQIRLKMASYLGYELTEALFLSVFPDSVAQAIQDWRKRKDAVNDGSVTSQADASELLVEEREKSRVA